MPTQEFFRPKYDPSLIRIGTIVKGKKPKLEGYILVVVVMTKSSTYGDLGP